MSVQARTCRNSVARQTGCLAAWPANNGFHLTGELAGLQTEFGFWGDSPEPPAG